MPVLRGGEPLVEGSRDNGVPRCQGVGGDPGQVQGSRQAGGVRFLLSRPDSESAFRTPAGGHASSHVKASDHDASTVPPGSVGFVHRIHRERSEVAA
ncbi:hypothetical protein A8924_2106 [Saccharopolyspora erythraea NRRL 2338]|uniref:Uncharacterized protein n=1 Tax=Saccharopolyspora erythraea TaxID=1836 RepID=A0ABP3MSK6_SACER|nr:hypothetical protein A8924_2106 [Saccharopolyspora erythraea NRRL 2338]